MCSKFNPGELSSGQRQVRAARAGNRAGARTSSEHARGRQRQVAVDDAALQHLAAAAGRAALHIAAYACPWRASVPPRGTSGVQNGTQSSRQMAYINMWVYHRCTRLCAIGDATPILQARGRTRTPAAAAPRPVKSPECNACGVARSARGRAGKRARAAACRRA